MNLIFFSFWMKKMDCFKDCKKLFKMYNKNGLQFDGHFWHTFVVKMVMYVWKEAGDGPFFELWKGVKLGYIVTLISQVLVLSFKLFHSNADAKAASNWGKMFKAARNVSPHPHHPLQVFKQFETETYLWGQCRKQILA